MRKILLVGLALIIILGACKKKSASLHCYFCAQYDSTGSGIRLNGITDTVCNETDGFMAFFVMSHVYTDTINKGLPTQYFSYREYHCQLEN